MTRAEFTQTCQNAGGTYTYNQSNHENICSNIGNVNCRLDEDNIYLECSDNLADGCVLTEYSGIGHEGYLSIICSNFQ